MCIRDSREGAYFITINTKYFIPWLGTIKNRKIELNSFGEIVRDQWKWLEIQYRYIRLDEFIVMPDHFHGIIWIKSNAGSGFKNATCPEENPVRAGRDRPVPDFSLAPGEDYQLAPGEDSQIEGMDFSLPARSALLSNLAADNFTPAMDDIPTNRKSSIPRDREYITRFEARTKGNSGEILCSYFPEKIKPIDELVGAFKTTSSKRIHLAGLDAFYWHRSYYDRIIRNTEELNAIRSYIIRNPSRWRHQ